MLTIRARIKGTPPGLLMARLDPSILRPDGTIENTSIDKDGRPLTPKEQAEKKTYRLPNGNLCIPIANLQACLREGGTAFKLGRKIVQNVFVQTPIDLGVKDYEVHEAAGRRSGRTAAPYMIYRPWLPEWEGEFTMQINEDFIKPNDVRKCLVVAGQQKGLGGWRPGAPKGGPYGRFEVIDFVTE